MSIDSPIQINHGAYRTAAISFDDPSVAVVLPLFEFATKHQVTVTADAGATGKLALLAVPLGCAEPTPILDETGTAIEIDLAVAAADGPQVVIVVGVWEEFQFVPTTVSATGSVESVGWMD